MESQEGRNSDFSVSSIVFFCFGLIGRFFAPAFPFLFACLLTLFCFLSWWSCNRDEKGYGGLGGEQNWGALCETPQNSINNPKKQISPKFRHPGHKIAALVM